MNVGCEPTHERKKKQKKRSQAKKKNDCHIHPCNLIPLWQPNLISVLNEYFGLNEVRYNFVAFTIKWSLCGEINKIAWYRFSLHLVFSSIMFCVALCGALLWCVYCVFVWLKLEFASQLWMEVGFIWTLFHYLYPSYSFFFSVSRSVICT